VCEFGWFSPVPWQEIGDTVGGVAWKATEDIGEPGSGIDAVQLAGLDQRVDGGGALAPAIRAGECPVVPSDGNLAVILPMSDRMSWFNIAGIRCTVILR
jgi:hypothetical protein